jgi:hypothetical protein
VVAGLGATFTWTDCWMSASSWERVGRAWDGEADARKGEGLAWLEAGVRVTGRASASATRTASWDGERWRLTGRTGEQGTAGCGEVKTI